MGSLFVLYFLEKGFGMSQKLSVSYVYEVSIDLGYKLPALYSDPHLALESAMDYIFENDVVDENTCLSEPVSISFPIANCTHWRVEVIHNGAIINMRHIIIRMVDVVSLS